MPNGKAIVGLPGGEAMDLTVPTANLEICLIC
jgi:hypothetical protein